MGGGRNLVRVAMELSLNRFHEQFHRASLAVANEWGSRKKKKSPANLIDYSSGQNRKSGPFVPHLSEGLEAIDASWKRARAKITFLYINTERLVGLKGNEYAYAE